MDTKNVLKKFLLSSLWYLALALFGIGALFFDREVYFYCITIPIVTAYLLRSVIFLNHYQQGKIYSFEIDHDNKWVIIYKGSKELAKLSLTDLKAIVLHLPYSLYAGFPGSRLPWDDILFTELDFGNGKTIRFSSFTTGKHYLRYFNVKTTKKFTFYPLFRSLPIDSGLLGPRSKS